MRRAGGTDNTSCSSSLFPRNLHIVLPQDKKFIYILFHFHAPILHRSEAELNPLLLELIIDRDSIIYDRFPGVDLFVDHLSDRVGDMAPREISARNFAYTDRLLPLCTEDLDIVVAPGQLYNASLFAVA